MLSKIKLSNFKCFQNLELNCAPLTLLCGLNGMGKSSVIQALLVLRQSFVSGDLYGGKLVLSGELADLGTGIDVLFEGAENDRIGFELQCDEIQMPLTLAFAYSPTADQLTIEPHAQKPLMPLMPTEWCDVPLFTNNFHYIDAGRIGPRKFYPLSGTFARRGDFGSGSEYALNYLNLHKDRLLSDSDPRCSNGQSRRLIEVVNRWLQEVTPGVHLKLETVPSADAIIAGFAFDQPGDVETRPYRSTNVGFGLSYTLPVLLSLLTDADTLCLIENPEAHLHPCGQTMLAELAVRAALSGVQVVVETHSDHFMDGVRIAVRNRLIAPEGVVFHYFARADHATVVSSPTIDSDGRLSAWPPGFFDQHEANLAKLLAPRS